MTSKVILRVDVAGLGKRGDIIEVSDGYARNFLLPRGRAMSAAEGTVAQAQSMRRARDLRDSKDREAAETVARVLVAKTIVITGKARDGKLFGSVTAPQVANAVKAQANVELDAKAIQLHDHIKTVGVHDVAVRMHNDVQFTLVVDVRPA